MIIGVFRYARSCAHVLAISERRHTTHTYRPFRRVSQLGLDLGLDRLGRSYTYSNPREASFL